MDIFNSPDDFKKHFFFTDNYENIETGNGIHTVEDITYRIKSDKILFYSGDTSYSEDVITSGHDSDIFIHEATFPSRLSSEAPKFGHSSVKDAINAFKKVNPESLCQHIYQNFHTGN
ncbi:MBL fold metallo-hydrolase [Acidiplasma cupricumulans]|uniref:MBL fold metallo-hydrolase n=1 Tax=Acidiplasma cupricumulans TaxID=312540 RepID=UPI001585394D|nr:MBL fold metallo-hydrolase [Acidiplasma cupricumulans]